MMDVPRSFLFVPASRQDRFSKAISSGAGGVILDLEDAVAEGEKDPARERVRDFLAIHDERSSALAVRINPLTCLDGLLDLAMLVKSPVAPDFVLVPKAEDPTCIELAGKVLDGKGSSIKIGALIESARGIAHAATIATAHPRLRFLMFGSADYAADLGQRVGMAAYEHARATIVNAAACGELAAIDSPYFDLSDHDSLEAECGASKSLGFHGKAAIHPSQVGLINAGFTPSASDKVQARRILEAAPNGVGVIEGQMIDKAMMRWAMRTI